MKLIIKKQLEKEWLSFTTYIEVPKIFYRIVKLFYEIRGYEVEVVEKDVI